MSINLAAIVCGLGCLLRPSRLRPTLCIQEFGDIPVDIESAIRAASGTPEKVNIKAIVVDKDNCLTLPLAQSILPKYQQRWQDLRNQFPGPRVLIVSNSSGTKDDAELMEAKSLTQSLETEVFLHDVKKPLCGEQVLRHLEETTDVQHAKQVVVIGDRLFTDVLMANLMGSYSIWIRRGAKQDHGLLTRLESRIYSWLV